MARVNLETVQRGAVLLALSWLASEGLLWRVRDVPASVALLVCTGSAILLALLLLPAALKRSPAHSATPAVLGWSFTTAVVAALLCVRRLGDIPQAANLFAIGASAFMAVLMFGALVALLRRGCRNTARAHGAVVTAILLATSAPLWLGPLLAWSRPSVLLTDAVVNVSPISHLAVMFRYDFLRSVWFYQHTPFPGLRYDYFSATSVCLVYVATAAALLIIEALASKRNQSHGGNAIHSGNLEKEPSE
jgi:hypothetical protein